MRGPLLQPRPRPVLVILTLEYLVALVCIANVVHVTYGLSVGVVTIILPDASYLPGIWGGTGIVVHITGALCLRSRLQLPTPFNEAIIKSEFTLSEHKKITVESIP